MRSRALARMRAGCHLNGPGSDAMNTSSDDIQPAASAQPACRNCGAPMLGAHCYAC